ncbi:MAG: hypothetical protein JXR71_07610 [Bacteroidales bacterium]|nr:hypothetical protein [Bacteroidales bacterium]
MALLLADVMIDPNNLIFRVKYVLFVFVLLVWTVGFRPKMNRWDSKLAYVAVFIGVFMPFYALSVGIINSVLHNVPVGNLVYLNSFFFFLLVLVTMNNTSYLTVLFNRSSLMIVLVTLLIYASLVLNPLWFKSLYQYFVMDKNVAAYALRNYGKITMLMIFYKTSSILVFPLSYYLYKILIDQKTKARFVQYLLTVLIMVTLFLSGTRANVLSLFLILIFYLGFFTYRRSKTWFVLVVSAGLVLFLLMLPSVWEVFMNRHEASNAIKFGYLPSYADFFDQNLLSLFFGQGIGGIFYASVLNRMVGVTELTYLELIRIWGIPIAVIFGVILIWPLVREIKSKKLSHLFIAYLAFLFIAGTNPLLLSSTGMLVLVYVFSMSFGKSERFEKLKS